VLGSGRLLGEVLIHVPEELAAIADPRGPGEMKDRERLVREASASLGWRDPDHRLDGLRRFKRREMLRVALADLSGTDASEVGAGLASVADACVEAALEQSDVTFAVIGMGKLGGCELNYSSDIDVMFVHEGDPAEAERVAESLLRAIGEVTPEGQAFRMDAALRPEGKSGPLARSLDSYLEYYSRWSEPWEHMALIKARASAGDAALGQRFIEATRELAFPRAPSKEAIDQIRHLKARMERERVPRGIDPRRHVKLGPGGLSDVEFSVQMLQLHHAAAAATLRVPGTLEALGAARSAGLIGDADGTRLDEAYRFLLRLRNRMFMIAARPNDVLPAKPEDLEALGIAMGFRRHPRQEVEEEYLRQTRRARRIAEGLIFGT
jgi:glutamate-ammonia-ligase adenylyltransferase